MNESYVWFIGRLENIFLIYFILWFCRYFFFPLFFLVLGIGKYTKMGSMLKANKWKLSDKSWDLLSCG